MLGQSTWSPPRGSRGDTLRVTGGAIVSASLAAFTNGEPLVYSLFGLGHKGLSFWVQMEEDRQVSEVFP